MKVVKTILLMALVGIIGLGAFLVLYRAGPLQNLGPDKQPETKPAEAKINYSPRVNFDTSGFQVICTKLKAWDPLESTCRHASLSIL